MPLVIISGLPCSGKTHRAQQIAAALTTYVDDNSTIKRSVLVLDSHHSSLDSRRSDPTAEKTTNLRDEIYNSSAQEKIARAEEFSAIKRALSKDTIVIADGLNYIKGYRYQLWCEAKAAGTRCCVVHVAAQEAECKEWNRERLRAWGREEDESSAPDALFKQKDTKLQGKDVVGNLMPESHTAIFGDRAVEHRSRSRSSSIDAQFEDDGGDDQLSKKADTMTLKSLYIRDNTDIISTKPSLSSNGHHDDKQYPTAESARSVSSIPIPPPTSSAPYSPHTLLSLLMRYEPPSPFSRWDTPLFTVPSSDTDPPHAAIYSAIFPAPVKPTSKKALSQLQSHSHSQSLSSENTTASKPNDDEVKPHAATVLPRATSGDALQALESATMDVVKALLARARELGLATNSNSSEGGGGDISFSVPSSPTNTTTSTSPSEPVLVIEATIHVPAGTILSQPMLQRLRRRYTQMQRGGIAHGQAHVGGGRRGVVEGFVRFLDAEWNDNIAD